MPPSAGGRGGRRVRARPRRPAGRADVAAARAAALRHGLATGLAVGAGIALVDALYTGAGAAGAAQLVQAEPVRRALGVLGAGVLVALGVRADRAACSPQATTAPREVAGL
ncbi:MAG: LysE family transporter, partial [Actinomycetota bacterium]|nr:LysE family transporter [Actinomycetota bacterium]